MCYEFVENHFFTICLVLLLLFFEIGLTYARVRIEQSRPMYSKTGTQQHEKGKTISTVQRVCPQSFTIVIIS
jgi:hypothetical protein